MAYLYARIKTNAEGKEEVAPWNESARYGAYEKEVNLSAATSTNGRPDIRPVVIEDLEQYDPLTEERDAGTEVVESDRVRLVYRAAPIPPEKQALMRSNRIQEVLATNHENIFLETGVLWQRIEELERVITSLRAWIEQHDPLVIGDPDFMVLKDKKGLSIKAQMDRVRSMLEGKQ